VTAPVRQQPYPWRVEDLLRWYGVLIGSVVGLAISWWGISGTASLRRSITWLDVAVLCLVLSGLGNMRWLLQGRRAVATRRRAELPAPDALRRQGGVAPAVEVRVAMAGAGRYHRPGCQAVVGKPTASADLAAHEAAGRRPCGLCAS
jgi:hypothetical protein